MQTDANIKLTDANLT